jgi:hypothetical protein
VSRLYFSAPPINTGVWIFIITWNRIGDAMETDSLFIMRRAYVTHKFGFTLPAQLNSTKVPKADQKDRNSNILKIHISSTLWYWEEVFTGLMD